MNCRWCGDIHNDSFCCNTRPLHACICVVVDILGMASAAAELAEEGDSPPDLKFPVPVFDVAFHPMQDVVAVGLISGKIEL